MNRFPNQDPKVESALAKLGATKFEYDPKVDLDQIDWEASEKNQTRIAEPIKEELVREYADYLQAGDVFPALILWRRPDRALFILDGLHRATAYRRIDEVPDAYILPPETPQKVRTLVSVHFNARHGLALDKADRVRHALLIREAFKLTTAEAARRLGLKAGDLQAAIDVQNADLRWAECLGELPPDFDARIWDAIRPTSKVALQKIKTDEGFIAAVQLAHDAGLSKSMVDDLVTELRPTRSAKQQLAIVEQWRTTLAEAIQNHAAEGSGRARAGAQPAHVRAALVVGSVAKLDPERLAALPERERNIVAENVTKGIERLTAVLDAIKAAGNDA